MKVIVDHRAQKELNKLSRSERNKVREYIKFFTEYGFTLSEKYLKKIDKYIWELRPANIRIFLTEIKPNFVVIHAMRKKSQKMTKETKQLITQRAKEWRHV